MNVKVKTEQFISLAEAKVHLRVSDDFTAEDSYIIQLVKAATGFSENYINKDIASTTNTLTLLEYSGTIIEIFEGNYRSVTSVTGSTTGLISENDYSIKYADDTFTITLDDSISDETMTIVYETGYILSTYPVTIQAWIKKEITKLDDAERGGYHLNSIKQMNNPYSLLDYYVLKRFV